MPSFHQTRANERATLVFEVPSGLYPLIKDHLAGGVSRLAALLLP
jgi:hypothetical protein